MELVYQAFLTGARRRSWWHQIRVLARRGFGLEKEKDWVLADSVGRKPARLAFERDWQSKCELCRFTWLIRPP
ncbi:hypothetical protein MesoLj131b_70070 (plasmid) [Mesorhizobium sp. 131-2-5]|nr:hypothetical protein MesoLj131b_70070 [Mesorhizobium sp. 131-2-5]